MLIGWLGAGQDYDNHLCHLLLSPYFDGLILTPTHQALPIWTDGYGHNVA